MRLSGVFQEASRSFSGSFQEALEAPGPEVAELRIPGLDYPCLLCQAVKEARGEPKDKSFIFSIRCFPIMLVLSR